MAKVARHDRILEIISLNTDGMQVSKLIEQMDFSPATIRRDLAALEKDGFIVQSRGRVRRSEQINPIFPLRGVIHKAEKETIGKMAASLVKEGDSIIIDSGTTTLSFACNLLSFQRLSVITNSIPIAYAFNGTAINTNMCGGTVNDMALVDNDAVAYLSSRRVDKAFLGACGVREEGLTILSAFQHPVKRMMIEMACETYALVDASKFGSSGIILFAEFAELTGLITNKPINNERILEQLDKHGVKVFCAEDGVNGVNTAI